MPTATVCQQMPCGSDAAFALMHDYSRRLEWDTLLCEARLTRGHVRAARGATSLCVGRHLFGLIGVETAYVTFQPGQLAAVKMINRPPFFDSFAASIRHSAAADGGRGGSQIVYRFQFTARPAFLRWLLHPLMLAALRHETRKRLRSLAAFLEKQTAGNDASGSSSPLRPAS